MCLMTATATPRWAYIRNNRNAAKLRRRVEFVWYKYILFGVSRFQFLPGRGLFSNAQRYTFLILDITLPVSLNLLFAVVIQRESVFFVTFVVGAFLPSFVSRFTGNSFTLCSLHTQTQHIWNAKIAVRFWGALHSQSWARKEINNENSLRIMKKTGNADSLTHNHQLQNM